MNTITEDAATIIGKADRLGLDSRGIAESLERAGLLRDDALDFTPLMEVGEIPPISTPVFHVDIDALALLDHFNNDEAKTFDMLAKLKDLLNP